MVFKMPNHYLPPNTRIYCISDIHGRVDLLSDILNQIDQYQQYYIGRSIIIYLGDYIDRGAYSKQVIDLILNHQGNNIETVYLRGNHEQIFLNFIEDKEFTGIAKAWFSLGGKQTLESYGITGNSDTVEQITYLRQKFLKQLPPEHYIFFAQTRFSYALGSYFFAHAGINPKYSLDQQSAKDLLWIREKFTESKQQFEKIIVHGHTKTASVALLPNRIGIDTGAYQSNVLTCLVLQEDKYKLIQTR